MEKVKHFLILRNSEPYTYTFWLNSAYFSSTWFCSSSSLSSKIIAVEYFYCFGGLALANSQMTMEPLTPSPSSARQAESRMKKLVG